jgi:hypothetical protein
MKHFFRGSSPLLVVTWFWNLMAIGVCLFAFAMGSGWHALFALGFLALWLVVELCRIGGNWLHDDEEARKVKVPIDH